MMMNRDVFQAVADPTRRAILTLIALQPMTPNAIAGHFACTRQSVSKHIRILTDCRLTNARQRGREIHYTANLEKLKEIDAWMQPFRDAWEMRFDQLDDLLTKPEYDDQK